MKRTVVVIVMSLVGAGGLIAQAPKLDKKANEAYISDGYGNKRVAVIDADTGAFKRYWGAYGNKPDDTNLGRYSADESTKSEV